MKTMPDEKWQKVREVFDSALRRKPEERGKFVHEVCGGDKTLLTEVESLLSSLDNAESFMETPALAEVAGVIETETKKLERGKCFGHYEIIEQIGTGGMGEVYLAADKKLDRQVAVKILNEKFSGHESNLNRFIQEAKAASALNHPNILTIYEFGESEDARFIVSEYIEGKTLREIIRESRLRLSEILDISIQITGALSAAHKAHLVHRDIKPENIMIRPDGYVKVLDFGLAKLIQPKQAIVGFENEPAKQNDTAKGVIMGTVNYMSPEQAKGEWIDERTDIFSFGAVIYEMIAGRTPFAGDSMSESFANLINSEPQSLSRFSEDAPNEMQRIVSKTLRKNKDERHQTMRELLTDLKNLKENLTFDERLERSASPAAPRSLFGRRREITAIENLLRREDVRLVTLTGTGGTGKTVLAQTVADGCLAEFPDGVFFVELAAVTNPDWIVSAIAQMLDVKETGGKSPIETLKAFLHKRRILLVLDNFEQIIAAAPALSELLDSSLHLKILVTSRTALRLSAENELVVPPLAVPPSDAHEISADKLKTYSSVELFVERARAVKPNFVLADENAWAIAEICTKLDGLPLAIELAAARVKLLSPLALLQRLENRLKLLKSQAKDLPARQQTMRDTIVWSYDLLGEKEKALFKQLAVFAGGFTVEAAEAICEETDNTEVLDVLESLVGSNLLQQTDVGTGETRLLMLETIREYSAEQLAGNAAEEAAMRRRHANFFLNYVKQIERNLMGANQANLLNQMEAERDNFRAALDWSRKTGDENQLKLAAALTPFWTLRGYLSEGIERLSAALENYPNAAPATRAKALASLGQMIWVRSDYVQAIAVCEESLALARQINYPMVSAHSLFVLGMSYWYQYGDATRSIAYLEESLSLYRELDYDTGVVFTLVVLAAIYQPNDLPRTAELLDESLAVAKRAGNNLALSIVLVNYGRLMVAKGDFVRAKDLCRESLKLRGELADKWGIVQCLEPLAAIAVMDNEPRRAAKILGAIDVLLESVGAQPPLIFRADHEPSLAAARAALDEETFAASFAEGRKLSINEIVSLALDESTNDCRDSEYSKTTAHLSRSETDLQTNETTSAKDSEKVFPVSQTAAVSTNGFKPLAAFALGALLIGAIGLGYYFFFAGKTAVGGKKSVAVLPLKPINTGNRDEIYEIGIADSLIHRLGSMKGFVVRPLSATRKYADIAQDPIAAGREQQVDYVLASNYQLAGGKIKVTAQLFNVVNGQIEETYKSEKDAGDIFAMQDAIAGEVGNILLARFATTSSSPTAKRGTTNEEAYRLYLQGMYLYGKRTQRASRKAVELLEQAVQLDPNYALAWAGKAHAHRYAGNLGRDTDTHEEYQKSVEAINEALLLDKDLSEAYSALCENKYYYEFDFAGAEAECKRAIALDPNSSLAHEIYGRYLYHRGRFDEGIGEIKTAVDLEPTSLFNQRNLGIALYYAGRYEEAVAQFKRVIAMDENFSSAYLWLRNALEMQGNYSEAFEWFMKAQAVLNADEETIQLYKTAYQTSGYQGVLREYAKKFDKVSINQYYIGAILNAQIGNKDEAFEYLEKSYQRREWGMNSLLIEPHLDSLRNDPRFDELVKRVGLK